MTSSGQIADTDKFGSKAWESYLLVSCFKYKAAQMNMDEEGGNTKKVQWCVKLAIKVKTQIEGDLKTSHKANLMVTPILTPKFFWFMDTKDLMHF